MNHFTFFLNEIEWNYVFRNFVFHVLASYKNDLYPTLQKHMENFVFPCFGANKYNLLHVTLCFVSLLFFGRRLFIST